MRSVEGGASLQVVDAQVHLAPDAVASDLIDPMEPAGVDAAVITNQSKYGPDNGRQLAAVATAPARLALVGGIDLTVSDIDVEVERVRALPGLVGVRTVLVLPAIVALWREGVHARLFAAAQRHGLPICMFAPSRASEAAALIAQFPDVRIAFDHLNLAHDEATRRYLGLPLGHDHVLDEIDDILALARLPNVYMKVSALPALSRAPYPFLDLWPLLHRFMSAFGPRRLLWGSDWTMQLRRCTYAESVAFIRDTTELGEADKEAVLGGALRDFFGWTPGRNAPG